jgi:ubiquinone/menaquinone biosynthesis C-methylase UbiE
MPNYYKQQVINFFNGRTTYDAEGDSHPKEARRLLEYVALKSGQKVLDIATGTGLVAIPAAKKVAPTGSVIGVDMSPGMLSQAREKIAAERINNLELIEADVESIDFAPEQFDLIFCCSAIVYLSDIPAILNKCHSWLKSGEYLAFTTPDKTSNLAEIRVKICQDLFGIDLPHIIRPLWTPEKCRILLQQSGFRDIAIEKHQYNRHKISKNYGFTRIEREFYLRGNPLLDLSKAQTDLLQAEYKKAVEQLIADQGEWKEDINLYIKARK